MHIRGVRRRIINLHLPQVRTCSNPLTDHKSPGSRHVNAVVRVQLLPFDAERYRTVAHNNINDITTAPTRPMGRLVSTGYVPVLSDHDRGFLRPRPTRIAGGSRRVGLTPTKRRITPVNSSLLRRTELASASTRSTSVSHPATSLRALMTCS